MSIFHVNRPSPHGAASAAAAESAAARAQSKVAWAEARAEKAMMICEALWILMREKLGLDDELLEKAVRAVDLQDGKLDGKVRHDVRDCPKCGRKVGRGRMSCVYCGTEFSGGVFG